MIRTALATMILILCCPAAYSQSKSTDYTADYQRTGLYHGEQVMAVAHVIEVYILAHAEAHLAQITAAV